MGHKLTFRHVDVIRAVMLTGSVTGAAGRLNVTQPAISHLVNDIEEILQFPLFDRRLGRLVPTKRAELLFDEIERSFRSLEAINELGLRLRDETQRTISLASVPVMSIALLPAIIRAYRDSIATDFFTIDSPGNEQVVAWVSSQKADLGFALKSDPIPGVRFQELARFRALCLLPAGHALAEAKTVSAADLIDDPMIATTRFGHIPEIIAEQFRAAGHQPRPAVECPAASAACALVAAGVGFALLDPIAVYPFRNADIMVKQFEPGIEFTFGAYWRDGEQPGFDRDFILRAARNELRRIGSLFPAGVAADDAELDAAFSPRTVTTRKKA